MNQIAVLSQETIDKIAAGEVVERPASVVKELVENSIDAGANAVTVEIRDGGTTLIRITDNGSGIPAAEVPAAFLRHATSKIRTVEDLQTAGTLGFRGEALSSIAAVSQVELITKTAGSLTGVRYLIEGGVEKGLEEIGAPEGTTFLVRNLFYNTPARKKFLKSNTTEAGYISDLIERLALSHPGISFKFMNQGQTRLHTSGNCRLRDVVYGIYGREITSGLLPLEADCGYLKLTGLIGKPVISRGNRNYEHYFVNGRAVRSSVIARAIEEAYKPFMMNHRYPFTVLMLEMDGTHLDANVHPTKMEVRFSDQIYVYEQVYQAVKDTLAGKELIPEITLEKKRPEQKAETPRYPEPFEQRRRELLREEGGSYAAVRGVPAAGRAASGGALKQVTGNLPVQTQMQNGSRGTEPRQAEAACQSQDGLIQAEMACRPQGIDPDIPRGRPAQAEAASQSQDGLIQAEMACRPQGIDPDIPRGRPAQTEAASRSQEIAADTPQDVTAAGPPHADSAAALQDPPRTDGQQPSSGQMAVQMELFDDRLLSRENVKEHRLIGQVFDTYWIVEFRDRLYLIDQHAAHEKVLYERFLLQLKEKRQTSQRVSPPVILTLTMPEEQMLERFRTQFEEAGFEIEPFGGREYAVSAVPENLYGLTEKALFQELLDGLSDLSEQAAPDLVCDRIATMACKAAVKGNQRMSAQEADALIGELLGLENPYHCPHGRPTIVSMSKYELEKKFKRVL